MKADLATFYVYTHHRATDGAVFYVGKGSGIRARSRRGRTLHWRNVVAKHGLTVTIVAENLTETEAFALEKKTIADIGRTYLCNLTDGGDGAAGHVHSDEHRKSISRGTKLAFENPEIVEKLRLAQIGRKHTEETKAKQRAAKIGKPRSPETVEKIRMAKLGTSASAETRKKMSDARKGYSHSPEAVEKMRQKAKTRSAETIAKQVIANTGKTRSDSARANMASAQKGKAVICSNGMLFEKITHAVIWLKENGHPKASVQSITKASSAKHRVAYGLSWRFKGDCATQTPMLR